MWRLVFIVAIFVFWFVLWAWVGFKVLEGVSSDIVVQAFENSYSGFNQALPSSTLWVKIEEVKTDIKDQINAGLKAYITQKIDDIF